MTVFVLLRRSRAACGELPLELRRDAEEDDAGLAGNLAPAAARGEVDAELVGERCDRDVVQRALLPGDLAGEAPLQSLRHPDEDAGLFSLRHLLAANCC